jgi:hypothetical protein
MNPFLDSRIRELHVVRYGVEPTERYLAVIANIPSLSDNRRGENHHLLARSIWPEYADLKANPWNRLRVSRAVHIALTQLQGEFEGRLRFASAMMLGQSVEALRVAGRKGGKVAGALNVISGHMKKLRESGACRRGGKLGGKRVCKLYPEMMAECRQRGGKTSGKAALESGQLASIKGMGGRILANKPGFFSRLGTISQHRRWHVNRVGGFNPNCKLCFEVI